MTGIFNDAHRQWRWNDYNYNLDLCNQCKSRDTVDSNIEFLLRFRIRNLLQTEDDNFDRLFSKYEGIEFTLPTLYYPVDSREEEEIITYFLKYKLTLGVGFRASEFSEKVNATLKQHFFIPILCRGKMWQIVFEKKFKQGDYTNITKNEWERFETTPLKCLLCHDYPFGLYPGNFIVNQNICYMRMFIWMDKNRLHIHKKQKRIIMYKGSRIISWPFLSEAVTSLKQQKSINHLGNMAIFTPGEVFTGFIDIVVNKIRMVEKHNIIIGKIQKFRSQPRKPENALTSADVCLMYRNCRKKKKYSIDSRGNIICVRRNYQNCESDSRDIERQDALEASIVSFITGNYDIPITIPMIDWMKYPKTKINIDATVTEIVQLINRGEIDAAITQTSVLNKEYTTVSESLDNTVQTRSNIDVYRTGRFNRNADTNYYTNLCGIACGIQKVLPRDSKTVEPRHITLSEIGFIDILNTPDSPRNCGLVLETVLDVIVASLGMTTGEDMMMEWLKRLIHPDVRIVQRPELIASLETMDKNNVYICANQTLYVFPIGIPVALSKDQYDYLTPRYGLFNYFRMIQYILKTRIPCVELLRESDNFWVCTSTPRIIYKVHADGLLYTTRELEMFERDPDQVERLLMDNNVRDDKFPSLWIGDELRSRMANIFGPSVRCTPRPNIHHLPRVSHAASSAKHAIGIARNTRMIGSLHQKNITAAFYEYSADPISLPGAAPTILIAGGFNNQEDGIVVRKSSIERGMFMGVSVETAALKISYSNHDTHPITFTQTVRKGDVLRRGQQIGWFKNVSTVSCSIENFSPEIDLEWIDGNGGRTRENRRHSSLLSVVWLGKRDKDAERDEREPTYRCHLVDEADIKHMSQIKLHVMYGYVFQPTVGDKLQTSTSQKGVITQLLTDQDTPYVIIKETGESIIPDIVLNPHFLKRQSLDVIELTGTGLKLSKDGKRSNVGKNQYMENCFSFTLDDAEGNLQLGESLFTGVVMNPVTGLPYLRPVAKPVKGTKYYYPPANEFVDEDGFACVDKAMVSVSPETSPHELVIGSLYIGNYFCVNNHNTTIYYSKYGDDVVKTEFTGTPVRGKRGGFSTGPQEHLSLSAMGVENFKYDITHLRSDFTHVPMEKENDPNQREEIIPASSTFLRGNDDFNMRELDASYGLEIQTFCKKL